MHVCIPSFGLLGITFAEKNVTKILMFENWRKRKIRNNGTNKQQQSDYEIHNTSTNCAHVPVNYSDSVPSFNFVGHTVPEKSEEKY